MSTKLIDISYWQGNLDFKKLKSAGINYIILRAGYGTTKDSRFDQYAKACQSVGIKIIGAYWFTYALNVAQAKNEATICINACKPYNIPTIFYDFEYDTVKKAKAQGITLGSKECNDFTIAFCDTVKAAGIAPGYYCNDDYYKTMYSDRVKNKGYYLWYAHYKSDYSYHESPISCDIFQYSSRARLAGFNQNFDGDICYNPKLLGNSTNSSISSNTNKGNNTMTNKTTKEQAINAVIKTAQNEIGYLEKKSNAQLNSKTANAGYNNFTKYWRDIYPAYQTEPWCAAFVSWCFMKAFGLTMAKKLLKHWPYVYCPTLGSLFTKNANPKVGDIVIFYRSGEFRHTGLVTKVRGDKFWTIEGNTSGASGIVANGGGVCAKSYYNSKLPGTKFCTPNYSLVISIVSGNSSTSIPTTHTNTKNYLTVGDKGDAVKTLQTKLNKVGYKLTVDGEYGSATKAAVTSFQKKYNLEVDGVAGKNTITKLNAVIAAKSKNTSSTTSKAPSKVRKFVGKVNKNNAPVRKNPGKKYAQLTSYPTLNKGNLVDVCDTIKSASGNDWYYICIGGKIYGYILSGHVDKQ
ncbi:CHAP domain-containing protein [Blautia obeum]|uniref:CHAP domain-containing protein n=1 Tax=Blautia obeum TaxID=40520 RepID=A0A414SJY8_9FIRM|nr:GH25 family lysozyme [Blautia obeum]RHG19894.1 CHAP domain-containing protein [Blautia obeum]